MTRCETRPKSPRAPKALAAGAFGFWLLSGLAGLVIAFIWFGTSHTAGHGNENLLLLSPLCLGLLPGAWAGDDGRAGRAATMAPSPGPTDMGFK